MVQIKKAKKRKSQNRSRLSIISIMTDKVQKKASVRKVLVQSTIQHHGKIIMMRRKIRVQNLMKIRLVWRLK